MVTVICQFCKRTHEIPGEPYRAGKPSHGICARCVFLKDPLFIGDVDYAKKMIKEELEQGIVWQGADDANISADELKSFEELVFEVRRENGEGEMRNK